MNMARKKVETAVSEGHVLPRDISWMYFNRRILQEAMRKEVPMGSSAVTSEFETVQTDRKKVEQFVY